MAFFCVVANDTHATAVGPVALATLCTWTIVSGWVRVRVRVWVRLGVRVRVRARVGARVRVSVRARLRVS